VFLREYTGGVVAGVNTGPVAATGKLLNHVNADGTTTLPTWADVKANALKLGIILDDHDVGNVPMLATDAYGNLILSATGLAQVVVDITQTTIPGGVVTHTQHLVSASVGIGGAITPILLTAPPLPGDINAALGAVTAEATLRIGHAFINDMASTASPFDAFGNPLIADGNGVIGGVQPAGTYDRELLDKHYVAGDGRVNENIGLTTVHQIFENEHNRLIEVIKAEVRAEFAKGDSSFALGWVNNAAALSDGVISDSEFNGARLFSAAKWGVETQYQHLVFEEFARKVVPTIHVAGETNIHLDAAITSEFANAVYRFGHSMLDESIQVQDVNPNGTPKVDAFGNPVYTQEGLIQAFTNPLDFAKYGAGNVVQGATNQVGNEIDEFVTGALRNNLLGLPLDLAAINIARGRDTGIPTLNAFRNEIYQQNHDTNLKPYMSWDDFRHYLKHDASIVNFVAAYGADASITSETNTLDKRTAAVDLIAKTEQTLSLQPAFLDGTTLTNFQYTYVDALSVHHHTSFKYVDAAGILTNFQFTVGVNHTNDGTAVGAILNNSNLVNNPVVASPTVPAPGSPLAAPIANADFDQNAWNFMHSTGTWANDKNPADIHGANLLIDGLTGLPAQWSTGSVTGLDNVDMWIGGLAEKQSLNGTLLGSTFELIFRVQLENLQDGDRLYYLPRIEGTHFSDQIEDNTFASMIMADSSAHHLPASIFQTMEYNIEAKDFYTTTTVAGVTTFNLDVNGNPIWDNTKIAAWNALHLPKAGALAPPLLEVTAQGELHFVGDDAFFGNTIMMGGTAANDHLLAGNADDDTVYGDGGNDTIDGGGGNDNLFGGAGNDLITDQAGNNVVHGDGGDDTIIMGKGDDNITGGDGNDLIYGGGGADAINGGTGNDIIFGGEGGDEISGGQGDDWIDGRGMNSQLHPKFGGTDGGDNLVGDVGAPTGQLPLYDGNDVMIGDVGTKMKGFGGDDIMLGAGGFNKFYGGTGFDWASFELDTTGVSADMKRREFISPATPIAGDGFRDVFTHVEGISGSKFSDHLIGEDTNAAKRLLAKDELYNFNLVHGLVDLNFGTAAAPQFTRTVNGTVEGNFFAQNTLAYAAGDIMLGGGGSDKLEGGGGDDIIDGDASLHVDLTRDANGNIVAGSQIIREIRYADKTVADAQAVDTAVYNDNAGNYTLTVQISAGGVFGPTVTQALDAATILGLNTGTIRLATDAQGFATVAHVPGVVAAAAKLRVDDGTDLVRNIERLEFADATVDISGGRNHLPGGALTISDLAPRDPSGVASVGDTITALSTITDADGIAPGTQITYQWQYLDLIRGDWVDVVTAKSVGAPAPFVPGDFFQGNTIRLKAIYTDGNNFQEIVTSDALNAGALLIADPTKNKGPTSQQRVVDFLADTSAYQGENLNIFIPIENKFVDDHTASAALFYRAAIVTADGVAHDISVDAGDAAGAGIIADGPFQGLNFTVQRDATGAVIGATITGTITTAAGAAGFNGPITVRVSVSDDGTSPLGGLGPVLTATEDFKINVLNDTGVGPGAETAAAALAADPSPGMGVHFDRVDLDFILKQIKMAEAHQVPIAPSLAFGLRTVSAEDNSILNGQANFGQSDQLFPRLGQPIFENAGGGSVTFFPGPGGTITAASSNYGQTSGFVFDNDPRLISNLIADQSSDNPAALAAALAQATVMPAVQDHNKVAAQDGLDPMTGRINYSIPNVTPDGGISAPYNTWLTLFGQFFDHGLDLVNKGGNGTVVITLDAHDPLVLAGKAAAGAQMFLTRGTMLPNSHETVNAVTPPVDLSQVYSSHPSEQVFLREYIIGTDLQLHSTGKLLTSTAAVDGSHHLPTWLDIKLNAARLGINLQDKDVFSVPTLNTDEYGNLILHNGHVQILKTSIVAGVPTNTFVDAGPININVTAAQLHAGSIPGLVDTTGSVGAGVQFINDMAQGADPRLAPCR